MRIVIIGAGPTGLGAAHRLKELGHSNFRVFERNKWPGGLSASFRDDKGFVWDQGGHIMFSHYDYYAKTVENFLGDDLHQIKRQAWVYAFDKYIPYPFQNHLHHLPKEILEECLEGLKEAHRHHPEIRSFRDFILKTMGPGIAQHFMTPYNEKVWAHPLEQMDYQWIAHRVSRVSLEDVIARMATDEEKTDWGPNSFFRFPKHGGTGELYRRVAKSLNRHITYDTDIDHIDASSKRIRLEDGRYDSYDVLINTMPLDRFAEICDGAARQELLPARALKHNSLIVVGLGLRGTCPSDKCWVYYPDEKVPFNRLTYLSNYSPHVTPDEDHYSLVCEITYSDSKPFDKARAVEQTIEALIKPGVLAEKDRAHIVSTFVKDIDYAYPVPTLDRDTILDGVISTLERHHIYSRGRFGLWRYEIANSDHSFMQGKEVADRILKGSQENVILENHHS